MTRTATAAVVALLLAALATGCVGYRDYYDHDADEYAALTAETGPIPSGRRARIVVNVLRRVNDQVVYPVSGEAPIWHELARETVERMQIFAPGDAGETIEQPDYYFLFNVQVNQTRGRQFLSGVIVPYFRSTEYVVNLEILDGRGQPFVTSTYTTSAQTSYAQHILLLPFAPFWWPGSADRRAERNLFQALTVQLIKARKEFL